MNEQEKMILQLADNMNILRRHLKSKGELDIVTASCLDWESIVKDEHLKEVIKSLALHHKI